MLVIAIGKGATGTRMLSHALSAAGVDMGPCNESGDLIPPEAMYGAVGMAGAYVDRTGSRQWDFKRLLESKPPAEFEVLVREYAAPVLDSKVAHSGWKLPETLFALPWIVQMFPDAAYVHWSRSPAASIGKAHLTDRLRDFGAPGDETVQDALQARIESWAYQWQIVQATPKPARWMRLRWEDVVAEPGRQAVRLSGFLGIYVPAFVADPVRVKRDTHLRDAFLRHVPADVLASYAAGG